MVLVTHLKSVLMLDWRHLLALHDLDRLYTILPHFKRLIASPTPFIEGSESRRADGSYTTPMAKSGWLHTSWVLSEARFEAYDELRHFRICARDVLFPFAFTIVTIKVTI